MFKIEKVILVRYHRTKIKYRTPVMIFPTNVVKDINFSFFYQKADIQLFVISENLE